MLLKKILLVVCVVLLAVPVTEARRKAKRAGNISDDVFTDSKYGFSLTLPKEWSAKISKEGENARLVLIKKNFGIPQQYINAEDYTKIPRIVLYVGKTPMAAHTFIDSLLSHSYESDQKNEIKKEFEFLYEQDRIPKGRKRIQVGNLKGDMWYGQSKYFNNISTGSAGGVRVEGKYGGCIITLKNKDQILAFHVMCEWDFFDTVHGELTSMVRTLEWGGEKGASESDES
jgi:hypothetical protein